MTLDEVIAAVEALRRDDIETLHALFRRSLRKLGYGTYRYQYEGGRKGEAPVVALSSRKKYTSAYVCGSANGAYVAEKYKEDLPKADIGKGCIRLKRVADVALEVLEKRVREGAALITKDAV